MLNPAAKLAYLEMHQQNIQDESDFGLLLTDEERRRLQRIVLHSVLAGNGIENPQKYYYLEGEVTLALLKYMLINAVERKKEMLKDGGNLTK